ncbi:MAG: hypothetical protein ROR55_07980 [Devosia sp.]
MSHWLRVLPLAVAGLAATFATSAALGGDSNAGLISDPVRVVGPTLNWSMWPQTGVSDGRVVAKTRTTVEVAPLRKAARLPRSPDRAFAVVETVKDPQSGESAETTAAILRRAAAIEAEARRKRRASRLFAPPIAPAPPFQSRQWTAPQANWSAAPRWTKAPVKWTSPSTGSTSSVDAPVPGIAQPETTTAPTPESKDQRTVLIGSAQRAVPASPAGANLPDANAAGSTAATVLVHVEGRPIPRAKPVARKLGPATIETGSARIPARAAVALPDGMPRPNPRRVVLAPPGAGIVGRVGTSPATPPRSETDTATTPSAPGVPEDTVAAIDARQGPSPSDDATKSDDLQELSAAQEAAKTEEADPQSAPRADPIPRSPEGPSPYRMVRTLTALQDDIARGSTAALRAQRVVLRRIADRFPSIVETDWLQPHNTNALAVYALSGGEPRVVRAIVEGTAFDAPMDAVLAGALAYMEGRAGDARRHLSTVLGRDLPPSVQGAFALAAAALEVEGDPQKALNYLDTARYAAPATLVEEAALRRAILISAELDDAVRFEPLVSRYLRKFRNSIYAGNFRQRLAAAITRMSFAREPSAFRRLEVMFDPMTAAGRQELYLHLARAAVEAGNHEAAAVAAQHVLETADPQSLDHTRARLYLAAARIVDPEEVQGAVGDLNALSTIALPDDDKALLRAAIALSDNVVSLPSAQPPAAPASSFADGSVEARTSSSAAWLEEREAGDEAGLDGPFAMPLAVEARVAEALASVDALLEENR